jgi:hypothetical protein
MTSPPPERATARRAPRARAFLFVGIVLGIAGVLAAASLFPPDPALGATLVTGYFLLWGIVTGLTGGLLVWLWADHRSKRRATEVTLGRLDPESLGPGRDPDQDTAS